MSSIKLKVVSDCGQGCTGCVFKTAWHTGAWEWYKECPASGTMRELGHDCTQGFIFVRKEK